MTRNSSKNFKMTFGNLERSLEVYKLDYLRFGRDRKTETLVFATHGFIKKVDKVPTNEIERALNIRKKYFESKLKK